MQDEIAVSPFLDEILKQTLAVISERDEFDGDVLALVTELVRTGDMNDPQKVLEAISGEAG